MKMSWGLRLYVTGCLVLLPSLGYSTTNSSVLREKKFYQELYSESTFYQKYDLVTESRVRSYLPLWSGNNWRIEPYLGVSLQYQSSGAEAKYFDNTATPALGILVRFFEKVTLQAQGGVRTVVGEKENKSEWDPKTVFSAGDFWTWQSLGFSSVFTEAYSESAYLPRVSETPVSILWIKQGYRFKAASHLYIDPYAEFFARESRSPDLGPSTTQGRAGVRTMWQNNSWTVAALVYRNFKQHESSSSVEGLFVVGGNF
ncbi:hypothetical protein [Bdellovibrio bacteriovorus]|uniref:hypothetical protein n=1 Tax=Bdellovibrio TaxID=958 RepID=UPI0035A8FD89